MILVIFQVKFFIQKAKAYDKTCFKTFQVIFMFLLDQLPVKHPREMFKN